MSHDHADVEPFACLHWRPESGFTLDAEVVAGETWLRLRSVPINADGTRELRAAPIELDRLEVLFKVDVDLAGAPGQVREASVSFDPTRLVLRAVVEDAETGEQDDVEAEIRLSVDGVAPESGGPRPVPPTEEDLDWDDETTYERMFSEGEPRPATSPTAAPQLKDERGFAALLKALASCEDDDGEDGDPEELDEASEESEEPPPPPRAAPRPAPTAAPKSTPKAPPRAPDLDAPDLRGVDLHGEGDARSLLELLVEHEQLVLDEEAELDTIVPYVAKLLSSRRSSEDKATAMSELLLARPEVEELFIDDDALAELIERW